MKFTTTFSALLVAVSFISTVSALAVPQDEGLVARAPRGGQRGGNKGQAAQGAAAKAAAAKAAAAKAAAAKGGKGGNTGAATTGNNAATATGGKVGNAQALQSSTQIDPSVIQTTGTGQNPPVAGQSEAAVSTNNFANLCVPTLATLPLTNGLQISSGSCNPIPIGQIPASSEMPSAKFQNPKNGDTIPANTPFTLTLKVANIQLGTFTAATQTYFANPQMLNSKGQIIGHTHFVVEQIPSLDSTTLTDPNKFTFFKGVDDPQDGSGTVSVNVTAGIPPGAYRIGTIMSSATHQPVIVPVAQHGLCDDVIYITATAGGGKAAGGGAAAAGGNNAAAGGAAAGAGGAAAAKGGKKGKGGQQAAQGQAAKGAQAAKGQQQAKGGKKGGKGKGRK